MFSKREALSVGWQTFKKNWKLLVAVTIAIGPINILPSVLYPWSNQLNVWMSVVLSIVLWLLSELVSIGVIKIYLALTAKKQAGLSDLFKHWRLIFKFLAGSIVYGLVILVGFILLIIPGIILSVRLQYWSFVLVDKDVGPIAALKESWRITRGSTINLLLFGILIGLVNLLGALALGLGLLVAIPTTWLATANVYRKLSESK